MIRDNERGRVVFGCGNFGGLGSAPEFRGLGDAREAAFALMDHARACGLTRFDTANTYGGGASETWLGEWLRDQDAGFRSRIQVATKVGNPHGCPDGDRPLSGAQIGAHLDRSLGRLGVERIDLYYLHEFDPKTPLEETLAAISRAIGAGKIDRFGVSNASLADLQGVLRLADTAVRDAFTCVQNEFSLLRTEDLEAVIPLASAHGLAYIAFSPLAGGMLSGKYRRGAAPDPAHRLGRAESQYAHYLTDETFDRIEALGRTADAAGTTLPGAALRFILDTPGVDSLIIAPRRLEHFESYGLMAS